jgi:hypothetical protein
MIPLLPEGIFYCCYLLKFSRNEELDILGKVRDYIQSRNGLAEEFIMA